MADEGASATAEEQNSEKTEKSSEQQQQEWNKERQYRDELSAAGKREAQLQAQLAQTIAERDRMKQDMDDKAEETEQVDLDVYENLRDKVVKLEGSLKETRRDLTSAKQQLGQAEQTARDQQGQKVLDDTLTKFDKEYGPHRNEVLPEVEEEYQQLQINKLPAAQQKAWVEKALKLAYIEKSDGKKPDKDDSEQKPDNDGKPVLDSGQGGRVSGGTDIKEGSLKDVKEQMKKLFRK